MINGGGQLGPAVQPARADAELGLPGGLRRQILEYARRGRREGARVVAVDGDVLSRGPDRAEHGRDLGVGTVAAGDVVLEVDGIEPSSGEQLEVR